MTEQPARRVVRGGRELFGVTIGLCAGGGLGLARGLPPLPSPVEPAEVVETGSARPGDAARALAGAPCNAAPPPTDGGVRRVHGKTRFVWIREAPDGDARWIGYLWFGGSVAVAAAESRPGPGCDAEWYPVEPRGFVCVDGVRATLDADDPDLRRVTPLAPDLSRPSPHRYGEAAGTRRYREPPGAAVGAAPFAGGAWDDSGLPLLAAPPFPDSQAVPGRLQEDLPLLRAGSAVALVGRVARGGSQFLVTADLAYVPAEHVRPRAEVDFQGVPLDGSTRGGVAFVRGGDRTLFSAGPAGPVPTGELRRLASVRLTGRRTEAPEGTLVELEPGGVFAREADLVVPRIAERTPWGASVGREDGSAHRPPARATWVETSVSGGWLVAYEGTHPVFATLTTPGREGAAPFRGGRPRDGTTPTGQFSVHAKFATATMTAADGLVHAEVPWVQNFTGPYAIHAAYWHDAWGEAQSGGCVNVSPRDGQWLFTFSEPRLPTGWHGVRLASASEGATLVVIRP